MIPGYIYNIAGNSNKQTTISQINNANEITLTANAKVSGTFSMSVNPTPSGNVFFTQARPYFTNPAQTGITWTPSGKVYSSENWANSGTDSFGPYLDVTKGPYGASDNGNFLTGGPSGHAFGTVELVSTTPHGLKTGFYIDTFYTEEDFTGTLNGTTLVTGITGGGSTKCAGQVIVGNGIPANTTIVSTTSTTLTMSASATTSGSTSLTLYQAFNWNFTGVRTFQSQDQSFPFGPLWVTGPNSIVILVGTGGTGGSWSERLYRRHKPIPGLAAVPIGRAQHLASL